MLNRAKITGPASFIAIVIGIVFVIYEVQGWKMSTPLAVIFVVILLLMVLVAIGMILFELFSAGRQFLERRATSASWLSREAPGLLDYEADWERANKRFLKELNRLGSDSKKVGKTLAMETKRTQALVKSGKPLKGTKKQKSGNRAAKSIDRSAIYVEKRTELFEALVKEITRNQDGIITALSLHTEEHKAAAQAFVPALQSSEGATSGAVAAITEYRNSVRSLGQQNFSRTIRIASKRLGDGLDSMLKVFQQFQNSSHRLRTNLENKLR